jgi:serine/threonine protein kinase/tetratricopeptide (TPR) repeat protein
MTTWNPRANDLFLQARELGTPDARQAYLDEVCAGDVVLRAEVESLLEASARAGRFLESPAPVPHRVAAVDDPIRERPGTVIGPYKLLEQIGEGGFGIVFMAEQTQPVRRKVALKLLKPGMDTRQVVARFEAERQALALMDHPNIARVLDGGETATGRPYFVMELVKGVPITEFCDRNNLSVPARLELFGDVCQAVQHAHQKGIIHRDLKPSNFLVTLQDGRQVVKVIDFGIAKALGRQLTDKTVFTGFAQMIGTPLYMSPEQAALSNVDVDTRSDIYSLGVLLYELLTGMTPFDKARLQEADYEEMRRILCEEEPAKPSSRLSTLGRAASTVSSQRRSNPRLLSQLLRGELDWISMKCLDKDRDRRYQTAGALAADVRHYLSDEVVEARPPSAWYRFRKFARRKKRALLMAACVFLALAGIAGGLGWSVRDRAARQAMIAADLQASLEKALQSREEGKWPQALASAKRAERLLQDGPADPTLVEQVQTLLRQLAEEEADGRMTALLEELRLRQADTDAKNNRFLLEKRVRPDYQQAFRNYGLRPDAMKPREAAELLQSRKPAVRATLLAALDDWLILARHEKGPEADWLEQVLSLAEDAAWRRRLRAARQRNDLPALEQLAKEIDPASQPPESLYILTRALCQRGAQQTAVAVLRRAQEAFPGDFWINHNLGMALQECRPPRYEEAIRFLTAAVALRPRSPGALLNLGIVLERIGRFDEAAALFRQAIALEADYAAAHHHLGNVLLVQGRLDEAIAAFREALKRRPDWAETHFNLGNALGNKGERDEAIAAYRRVLELKSDDAEAHCNLGSALRDQGKFVQALAEFQQGHELGIRRPRWPYPSAQWVRECRRLIELDNQLPAILRGEAQIANAAERGEYAQLCFYKKRYLTAVRFWADAFDADPKLADDLASARRENAARAATLAAAGQGVDASRLDDKERIRWRKQALQWLREDLTAQAKRLESRRPQDRLLVRQRLWNWECEHELASLRDPAAVALLPADEQQTCRQFWAAVEALRNAIDSGQ